MDYEAIISEKFPNCNVEVIEPDFFELKQLIEYITDDIIVYKPHSIIVYHHMLRFLMNIGEIGKIYYLKDFSEDDLNQIHEELLKFTYGTETKINLYKNADPDMELLDL